jgi:hypothetical protein
MGWQTKKGEHMKKLLGARWHRLPIGIITAFLLVGLVAGGVFAAVTLFSGTANVTVNEAITFGEQAQAGSDGSYANGVWTVRLYPGETKTMYLAIYNASSANLPVYVTIGASDPNLSFSVNGGTNPISVTANSGIWVPISVTANNSCPPSTGYSFPISMAR